MRSAKLYQYALPICTGGVLRQSQLRERTGLLVQLSEQGRTGWGEIAPLPTFSQESLAQAESETRRWLKTWLAGEKGELAACLPSVAFGLSCALAEISGSLNAEGNYACVPLFDQLDLSAKTPPSPVLAQNPPLAKLKIGRHSPEQDGLAAAQLLQRLPHLRLRLDANRAWSLAQAVQFAEKLTPAQRRQIDFIEEPCHTPALSLQFAERCQISIAWDERVREADFVVKKQPNLTALVLKPTLIGSIERCAALIHAAHSQGMQAVISSSLESSLGLTQLARLAAQYTPDTPAGLDTLNLMQHQLIRPWQGATQPLISPTDPNCEQWVWEI